MNEVMQPTWAAREPFKPNHVQHTICGLAQRCVVGPLGCVYSRCSAWSIAHDGTHTAFLHKIQFRTVNRKVARPLPQPEVHLLKVAEQFLRACEDDDSITRSQHDHRPVMQFLQGHSFVFSGHDACSPRAFLRV